MLATAASLRMTEGRGSERLDRKAPPGPAARPPIKGPGMARSLNLDAPFLEGQVAVVTGASSGMGRHFATLLARRGARVAICARRIDLLESLAREIASFDGRALPVPVDVTDAKAVDHALATAETELGPISLLVNNAGMTIAKPLLDQTEEDWDRVVDTNLKGVWLFSRSVACRMKETGGGNIINVGSILGMGTSGLVAGYAASKAGAMHLTRVLALELARHRIRVNAIVPGYVLTDLSRAFMDSAAGARTLKRIPQRHFVDLEDLDGPFLLLASEASRRMTGAMIVVDGGHTATSL